MLHLEFIMHFICKSEYRISFQLLSLFYLERSWSLVKVSLCVKMEKSSLLKMLQVMETVSVSLYAIAEHLNLLNVVGFPQ
jgi:hypothetical protein